MLFQGWTTAEDKQVLPCGISCQELAHSHRQIHYHQHPMTSMLSTHFYLDWPMVQWKLTAANNLDFQKPTLRYYFSQDIQTHPVVDTHVTWKTIQALCIITIRTNWLLPVALSSVLWFSWFVGLISTRSHLFQLQKKKKTCFCNCMHK